MVMLASILALAAGSASAPANADRDPLARAPVTTTDIVELSEVTAPTISPDGRLVAFRLSHPSVDGNRTTLSWEIRRIDGTGDPVRLDGGTERPDASGVPVETAPVWDTDSRGIRFLALKDGVVAVWHWRDGEPRVREIVDEADIIDFGRSPDGKAIRYSVGATRAEIAEVERSAYRDGVVVDGSVNLNQPVAGGVIEDGQRTMRRITSAWFDNHRILSEAPQLEKRHDVRDISQLPAPAAPEQGTKSVSPDGSIAEILGEKAEQLLVVRRPDGRKIRCTAEPCRSGKLQALVWRPDGSGLVLFEKGESAREAVWLWKPRAARAKQIAVTSGALRVPGRPPRCTVAKEVLICADAQALVPPRLTRIDLDAGTVRILAEPNKPLETRIAADVRRMAWPGGFTGYYLKPRGAIGPLPVVVQYYMCDGFLKGGTGDEIPMLPLTEHGIAVLCIDAVRAPRSAGMEGSYDLALMTIGTALDHLAAEGEIDPARVGIGGLSFGSSVALWSIRKSRRFAAATVASGQISPHYYWINALPGRGFAAVLKDYWSLGDPDSDPERWRLISPIGDVDRIDTPLLMQLPESEIQSNVEFHTRLKRAGKPAEMVVFADELHIKYQPAHKRASYERNLDWFRFWLMGEEDPDPAKQAQYRRWHKLRAGQS